MRASKKERNGKKTDAQRFHPTNNQVQRIEQDIRALRIQNKSDSKIRDILGLEPRTYRNYSKRIHDEDTAIWYAITAEEMAGELIRLKSSFEDTYLKAKALSESSKDVGEILDALADKDSARVNIIMLLRDGPGMMAEVHSHGVSTSLPDYDDNTAEDSDRPTTYPTIRNPDLHSPNKWLADPAWIEANQKRVMDNSNL